MKSVLKLIPIMVISITIIACNSEQNKNTDAGNNSEMTHDHSSMNDSSLISIDAIINDYLELKNSLAKDNANDAADAGKKLYKSFESTNSEKLDSKLKAEYIDIVEGAKEHAEHIGDNAGKIDHQREHFVLLSKDMQELLEKFGSTKKLYLDFCPMADDGNGAFWISEIKEIKNPYYGSNMQECGSIKKEY